MDYPVRNNLCIPIELCESSASLRLSGEERFTLSDISYLRFFFTAETESYMSLRRA